MSFQVKVRTVPWLPLGEMAWVVRVEQQPGPLVIVLMRTTLTEQTRARILAEINGRLEEDH